VHEGQFGWVNLVAVFIFQFACNATMSDISRWIIMDVGACQIYLGGFCGVHT